MALQSKTRCDIQSTRSKIQRKEMQVFTFAVNSSDRVLRHLKTEARFEFAAGERGGTTVRSQRPNAPIENQRETAVLDLFRSRCYERPRRHL
jgi:hypothetical protein